MAARQSHISCGYRVTMLILDKSASMDKKWEKRAEEALGGLAELQNDSYRLPTLDNLGKPQTPESKVVGLQNKTVKSATHRP